MKLCVGDTLVLGGCIGSRSVCANIADAADEFVKHMCMCADIADAGNNLSVW